MAATTAWCTSSKVDVLKATTDFDNGADAINLALIKGSMAGTYGAASTNYSDITGNSDEVANSGSYSAGGIVLTNVTPTSSGTTGFIDFNDASATTFTGTARAMMNYNDTDSNVSVSIHDFGADKTATAGTFTIQFPAADASNAILRIG